MSGKGVKRENTKREKDCFTPARLQAVSVPFDRYAPWNPYAQCSGKNVEEVFRAHDNYEESAHTGAPSSAPEAVTTPILDPDNQIKR